MSKVMRLRYAGQCRGCGAALSAGTRAVYERELKRVCCLECSSSEQMVMMPSNGASETAEPAELTPAPDTELAAEALPTADLAPAATEVIAPGIAGASARREYERRAGKREDRIRTAHPRLGGLILALSDEPQSTRAWGVGAKGEEMLGKELESLAVKGVRLLHDRRIPPGRGNIDHLAVSAAGVFIIDAKRYQGRPTLQVEGGMLRPRVERLVVGRRDCTKLVAGVTKQVEAVRGALERAGLNEVPVTGMMCFVTADWPLIGGAFQIGGCTCFGPRRPRRWLLRLEASGRSRSPRCWRGWRRRFRPPEPTAVPERLSVDQGRSRRPT